MKMKVLKMAILMVALLVVSGLREHSMSVAKAEEPLLRFEVGSESMWEKCYLEIVDRVESDEIAVNTLERDGQEYKQVIANNVPVSNFHADDLMFVFHDDEMCLYSYVFSSNLTEERYEYLLNAMISRYGEAEKQDFSAYELSNCRKAEWVEDNWHNIEDMKDGNKGISQKVMLPLLVNAAPEAMYEWDIDHHTHVTLCYCEKTSIFAKDAVMIVYSNALAHGDDVGMKVEYNVDGL